MHVHIIHIGWHEQTLNTKTDNESVSVALKRNEEKRNNYEKYDNEYNDCAELTLACVWVERACVRETVNN